MDSYKSSSQFLWLSTFKKIYGTRIEKVLIALLRMPGLFLIDNYFKYFNHNWSLRHRDWSLILSHFALLSGFILLLLPIAHLKRYYTHLVCWIALIYLSKTLFYLDNLPHLVPTTLDLNNRFFDILYTQLTKDQTQNILFLLFHFTFDLIILSLFKTPTKMFKFSLAGYAFLATISLTKCSSSNFLKILDTLSYAINSASLLNYFFKHTPMLLNDLKRLGENIIALGKNEGLGFLCWKTFKQIFVPIHFFLFWALTFVGKLYQQILTTSQHHQEWTHILLNTTSSIFISPISLLSTSIAVAYMSCFVLTTIKLYLSGRNSIIQNPNVYGDHNGWEEGMTTLLLTTITSFIDMNNNTRMAVIVIISFVVISSLLQSILEISEPVVLSLNFNHNTNRVHHVKVLLLCAFLFCFPLYITYVYAQIFPANFWIAVIFSTSLLISARVLDLVVVHCLFWWDSCRKEPWEYLDEVIYYARSFTKILELLISISVVIVGVWEAKSNRSNVINASILIMHGYYNVWQRINRGLTSYFQRRKANRVVDSLTFLNAEQINKCDDLCSICYIEMQTSSVCVTTDCNHLFHRQCIKKWLAIQNRCPLCSSTIDTQANSNVPGLSLKNFDSKAESSTINDLDNTRKSNTGVSIIGNGDSRITDKRIN